MSIPVDTTITDLLDLLEASKWNICKTVSCTILRQYYIATGYISLLWISLLWNFIILKNTCVSHNNPHSLVSEWGDTSMLQFLATTSKFFTLKPLSLRNTQVSLSTYENDFLLLLIIIILMWHTYLKVFKLTSFECRELRFGWVIWYFLPSTLIF